MKLSQELEKIRKNVEPTKTLDFLVPLTGWSKMDFHPYLVNGYLNDIDLIDEDENSPDVFVLLKYSSAKHFYDLEKRLEKDKYFKTSYSLFKGKYVMFIFTLGATFKEDYYKFLDGKYSELSEPAKIRIMRHRANNSPMPLILDKDITLKEYWEKKLDAVLPEKSEVWPIVNQDEELFDQDQFKKMMSINTNLPSNLL